MCSGWNKFYVLIWSNKDIYASFMQAKCLETGETVAIKKVLQDKRYKNRELQTMRLLDHPNVVSLKHCFFSTTEKEELYLNLVLEYVPETVHRVIKHYNKMNQRMPMIYVKLYTYQVCIIYIYSLILLTLLFFIFIPQSCWIYIFIWHYLYNIVMFAMDLLFMKLLLLIHLWHSFVCLFTEFDFSTDL